MKDLENKEKLYEFYFFLSYVLNDYKCTHNLKFTKAILKRRGFNVSKMMNYFKENGGYCDCEVLYNVASEDKGYIKYLKNK